MEQNNPICITQLNHTQIMAKLEQIEKRMDADWPLIEATHKDLDNRQYLWNIVKWIGFGGIMIILTKLLE